MRYASEYASPIGDILIASDGECITGLWFSGQKYYADGLSPDCEKRETAVISEAKRWLDIYFDGAEPDFTPPLRFIGTDFQKEVWEMLCAVPYGGTVTYGALAKAFAEKRGIAKMSAQAVGGAVGRNRISVIVPCHRVIGADGSLTGYAGGVEIKRRLLEIEK